MAESPFYIIKATGESVPFDERKLRHSLMKSGASELDIQNVVDQIREALFNGMTTRQIYTKAFRLLKKKSHSKAARYKLKNALMELGPSGFQFEKFVAKLLEREGYTTEVGKVLDGVCVRHEIDVIAERGNEHIMIECKFHNEPKRICDVKVPLYIYSRFKDVEDFWRTQKKHAHKFYKGYIFTNTRFSIDAIDYGKCKGLHLVSWDYPKVNNLRDRIDRSGLHPITCLTTISQNEKQQLLAKEYIFSADIVLKPQILAVMGMSKIRQKRILQEAIELKQPI